MKLPEVWPMMPYPFNFPKKTAGQILSLHGIQFEKGAYALHDPWRQTLTVHNTMDQLQKLATPRTRKAKQNGRVWKPASASASNWITSAHHSSFVFTTTSIGQSPAKIAKCYCLPQTPQI